MGVGNRFIGGDHAAQQLAQHAVCFEVPQQIVVPTHPLIHLRDEDAADPQVGMPPTFADLVDLADDAH